MPFTDRQTKALTGKLNARHVRTRIDVGLTLSYIEGWHAIAEANRIFGFEHWDRETVECRCVWHGTTRGRHGASYIARVRIRVRAGRELVVREGSGAGQGQADNPGGAHDVALKTAETDATKRALATFGNPFGLALYDPARRGVRRARANPASKPNGRPVAAVDKSALAIGTPRRQRDKIHLKFVAGEPCLVCGRQPSQAHHLAFMQPRALASKVSDEWTVPLCALHHRELHDRGDEQAWWRERGIEPEPTARLLWQQREQGPILADISQITPIFREIVPPLHRQGNCNPSAAIRWPDFGDRPSLGRPFAQIFRHSDILGSG